VMNWPWLMAKRLERSMARQLTSIAQLQLAARMNCLSRKDILNSLGIFLDLIFGDQTRRIRNKGLSLI
jgi:hypothetical protein